MWRRGLYALNVVAAVLIGLTGATAQTWPSKPIRIIVPFTAGSGTDMVARTVAEQLSAARRDRGREPRRRRRHARVGAVAKADRRSYDRSLHDACRGAGDYSNPLRRRARPAGVTSLVSLPNVLVVAPNKYKTLKDLVDTAKAKPGAMNYAGVGSAARSTGNGSGGDRYRRPAFRTRVGRKGHRGHDRRLRVLFHSAAGRAGSCRQARVLRGQRRRARRRCRSADHRGAGFPNPNTISGSACRARRDPRQSSTSSMSNLEGAERSGREGRSCQTAATRCRCSRPQHAFIRKEIEINAMPARRESR